ncbi:MAG TPA: VOC family protein [Dongiaceae bacterium]|jgi:predicted enzyme related to lactoylglutathione lyase
MHKSRLGGFIIDCKTDDLAGAADFWSQALGMEQIRKPTDEPSPEKYVHLKNQANHLDVEVQTVDHPSRVHLDIETDDIEAEVKRLEKLGARKVQQIDSWWVMEAPTGQRFCVVRARQDGFAAQANVWK